MARMYGGVSSVGRALVCGTSGRGFEPHTSPRYYFVVSNRYDRYVGQLSRECKRDGAMVGAVYIGVNLRTLYALCEFA